LVCRHPEVKAKLLSELRTLSDDFDYERLKALPYLNLVIEETLRMYSAAPAGLPRTVPHGGAEFLGYHIPAGYTVAVQAYSFHRNDTAFPDPLKFNPERWENQTKLMKDSFVPFGGGSRSKYYFKPVEKPSSIP
jgi:cytochrome P450